MTITLETLAEWTAQLLDRSRMIFSHMTSHKIPATNPPVKGIVSRRRLGCCHFEGDAVTGFDFNVAGLAALGEKEARLTVIHEVAHAVAFWTVGSRGHDAWWSKVCKILGGDGLRLHRCTAAQREALDQVLPAKRRQRFHVWMKDGAELLLTPRRHRIWTHVYGQSQSTYCYDTGSTVLKAA